MFRWGGVIGAGVRWTQRSQCREQTEEAEYRCHGLYSLGSPQCYLMNR